MYPDLQNELKSRPIIYVVRDFERAIGLEPGDGYHIISNNSVFAKQYAKNRTNILLINEDTALSTRELLLHPEVISYIEKITNPQILIFKPSVTIERMCKEKGWNILNPSAELANRAENKIDQISWLGPLASFFPPHEIKICKDIVYEGEPFIVQFNRSHSGEGTILIENADTLEKLKTTFPDREARLVKFIHGPIFTNNNIVGKDKILIGNISYQITGIPEITDNKFTTVGNDWHITKKLLPAFFQAEYEDIAYKVAARLHVHGWLGLFGLDVIFDEKNRKLYLLEINARQPASTSYESILQTKTNTNNNESQITTFEAHLLAMLGSSLKKKNIIPMHQGAQIIQRITSEVGPLQNEPNCYKKLKDIIQGVNYKFKNCTFIFYANTKHGSELVRIQYPIEGFMLAHNSLNSIATSLADFARKSIV